MQITVEISMYPFQQNYRQLIGEFIVKLNQYQELRVITCATSTMVVGEYNHVMQVFQEMLKWSYEVHGKAVFVTKFIPGHDPEND